MARRQGGCHGKLRSVTIGSCLTLSQSLWLGFYQSGNTYLPNSPKGFVKEIQDVVKGFNTDEYLNDPVIYDGVTKKSSRTGKKAKPFAYLFDTTGIMQHNDIGPQWHPTDVGQIKVASHLLQYIKLTFGWQLQATGPE